MTALCRTCAKARVSEGRQCERCWVRSVPVLRADALDEDQAEREAADMAAVEALLAPMGWEREAYWAEVQAQFSASEGQA